MGSQNSMERKVTAIEGYTAGWKECTEHYKQLIEDGMKWQQMVQEVEYQSSRTNDPMAFHLSVGEIIIELINKK